MNETKLDQKNSSILPLDENQKNEVIENFGQKGTTFFSWGMLQRWLKRYGPNAKVADVQKALKEQHSEKKQ